MLENIKQLPDALLRLVTFYETDGYDLLISWAKMMVPCSEVLFSGMGTSEFAPLFIRHKLLASGKIFNFIDAGEWLHYVKKFSHKNSMVVLISQSGESFETKSLVHKNFVPEKFVVLTNNEQSTLGRRAELTLPLCAGEELAISTKTYTNTLALLYLMSAILKDESTLEAAFQQLKFTINCLQLSNETQIASVAEFLLPGNALAFVGRGPAYVCAKQCALTFMEGARCLGAAFTGGAFRHGPLEALGSTFGLVIFVPQGKTRSINEGLGREAARLGAKVVFITDTNIPDQENIKVIQVKNVEHDNSEDLFPIVASGTHPLLLYHLAKAKGLEAGDFRYVSKVTTRE